MNIRFKSYFGASKCDFFNKNNTACTDVTKKDAAPKSVLFAEKMPVFRSLLCDTVSFGSKYSFDLKTPRGIPCAYCGKEMVSRDEIEYLVSLKGVELANELERITSLNKTRLKPQIIGAVELIQNTAIDNPDKDAQSLLPVAYTRARNRMLIKQTSVYSAVESLARKVNSKELLSYIGKVKSQDILIKPDIGMDELSDFLINKIHIDFRKDIIMHVFDIATKNMLSGDTDTWVKIANTISSLPSSKTDPDAYLVKYISQALRKDPKMANQLFSLSESESELFFTQLFGTICSSAEHIKPFSKNGESSSKNYLIAHSFCNTKRGSVDWKDFMLKKPYRFTNVLNNLGVIATNPDIARAIPNFSIPAYISSVKKSIATELDPVSEEKRVKNFLKGLSEISVKKLLRDESVYHQELSSMLKPFVDEKNPVESAEKLDKIFLRTIDDIIDYRRRIYVNLITYTPNSPDKEVLQNFLRDLMLKDEILRTKELPKNEIVFFTNDYNDAYLKDFDEKVKSLGIDLDNPVNSEFIANVRRKLGILKKPRDFCVKMILDSVNPDGTYNTKKLRMNLEELKTLKSKK